MVYLTHFFCQRELLSFYAILPDTFHGPQIHRCLRAGRIFRNYFLPLIPPLVWITFSRGFQVTTHLCLNISGTELTVFPGNPFHIQLLTFTWLDFHQCRLEKMILNSILHWHLFSSADICSLLTAVLLCWHLLSSADTCSLLTAVPLCWHLFSSADTYSSLLTSVLLCRATKSTLTPSSTQELLNIQNSGFLLSQHLLIFRPLCFYIKSLLIW